MRLLIGSGCNNCEPVRLIFWTRYIGWARLDLVWAPLAARTVMKVCVQLSFGLGDIRRGGAQLSGCRSIVGGEGLVAADAVERLNWKGITA